MQRLIMLQVGPNEMNNYQYHVSDCDSVDYNTLNTVQVHAGNRGKMFMYT